MIIQRGLFDIFNFSFFNQQNIQIWDKKEIK